jgi:hypothetical protein
MSVDLLFSFAFHKRIDLAAVRDAVGNDANIMIDSGAFTAHSTGKPIKLADYMAFLEHWRGVYNYAMSLDVVHNTIATARNLVTLTDAGHKVLPVYTATANERELRRIARDFDYIAYGGMVGVPKTLQQAATKRVVDICRETNTRVHALGQASAQMFAVSQAHSGDSSAVSRMTLIRSLQIYDYSRRQMINGKIGNKDDWRNNARLYQSYGLNARAFISGAIIKEKEQRLIGYQAGLLSTALLANHLQRNNKQPIMYSSLGNGEILISGKQVGIDWRTNNLHPQLQRAKIRCDA